jgi:hypothetical protein
MIVKNAPIDSKERKLKGGPEIKQKLKHKIETVNILDSPKDEYINAVISEAMRLYPAAWMTERVALNDDRFNGFSFPRGTIIIPFFMACTGIKNIGKMKPHIPRDLFLLTLQRQKKQKVFFRLGRVPGCVLLIILPWQKWHSSFMNS